MSDLVIAVDAALYKNYLYLLHHFVKLLTEFHLLFISLNRIYNILNYIIRKQSHCFFDCPNLSHFYNVKTKEKSTRFITLKNDITF